MDKAGTGALKFWAFQDGFVHDQFNRSVWRVGYHILYLHKHRGCCDEFDIHNFLDFFKKALVCFRRDVGSMPTVSSLSIKDPISSGFLLHYHLVSSP